MSIKRIICYLKGHDSTVTFEPDTFQLEVGGICLRCGHNLHPYEAYRIMRKTWEKAIEQ